MDFDLEWNGEQVCDEVKEAATKAVVRAAEVVLADCNPPVDTGELKDSGHVEAWPVKAHGTVGASVVFDAPHAHLVHELPAGYELENGEEKWLEKAADRKRQEVLGIYDAALGGVLSDR